MASNTSGASEATPSDHRTSIDENSKPPNASSICRIADETSERRGSESAMRSSGRRVSVTADQNERADDR